jgi:hypothetical protein
MNKETNMATSWKCTTENCPGTLAHLTLFEPRLLEQYIDAADGKIKTDDDHAIDDNPAWFECSLCGRRYEADEAHDDDTTLTDLWVHESQALSHEHEQQKIENATAKRRATLVEKRRQQYEADTGFRKPQ